MSADAAAKPLSGIRRIVTGHREDGIAIVKSDKVMESHVSVWAVVYSTSVL